MTKTERNLGGAVPRYLAILVAAVLGLSLFPAAAMAAHNDSDVDPCENAPVANEYVDRSDARNVHEPSIDCVIYLGIAIGSTNSSGDQVYNPLREVTRGQMASFIAQTLDAGGYDDLLSDGQTDRFNDIASNVHKRNINRLADANIVVGTGGGAFSPNASVTRQQMASFIVQAAEFAVGDDHPVTSDGAERFVDVSDSNVHKDNIEAGADADPVLFRGVTPTTFEPGANVLRDQMATFLVNLIRYIYAPERVVAVTVADSSVGAGQPVTGTITNATDATVTGCGITTAQDLNDTDGSTAGFQFSVTIPSSQAAGNCTLTFDVTRADGEHVTRTVQITVEGAGGAGQTIRPELVSADIVRTVTTSQATVAQPAGTYVRYTFDEPVGASAPTAANFLIYEFDSTSVCPAGGGIGQANASGGCRADFAEIESGNNRAVIARFNVYDTAAEAGDLSVATVDPGAVRDADSNTNPEGDDGIGSGGSTSLSPGITIAPDLSTVGGFRAGTNNAAFTGQTNNTAVDFTFDEAAFAATTGGFRLALVDGSVVNCTGPASQTNTDAGGQTVPGGNGTTTITVVCPNPANRAGAITDAEVARGIVDGGTVSDANTGGNLNAMQASQTPDRSSVDPDLVSATLTLNTAPTQDTILYIFDEFITQPGGSVTNCAALAAYTSGAPNTPITAGTCSTSPGAQDRVVKTFTADLSDVVGAEAFAGAVTAADNGGLNDNDEVGVTNSTTTTRGSGTTAAPDLTAVTLNRGTNAFGQATTTATYTFDENVDPAAANILEGSLFLYLADGTQLVCTDPDASAGTSTSPETRNQVTCENYNVVGGGAANAATVADATLGTVQDGAVRDAAGTLNPEGASATTGGTGTPRA